MQAKNIYHVVDKSGNPLAPPKTVPIPNQFIDHGLQQIGPHIEQLLASCAPFSSLIISTSDGNHGFSLRLENDRVQLTLFIVDQSQNQEREAQIREFFRALNFSPVHDWLVGNGGIPNQARGLTYTLTGNGTVISNLCVRLLSEIYSVTGNDALGMKLS